MFIYFLAVILGQIIKKADRVFFLIANVGDYSLLSERTVKSGGSLCFCPILSDITGKK